MALTTRLISISFSFRVAMARRIRSERSYTGMMRIPGGRDGVISLNFSLTRSITASAFSPYRMTTMPPTTSPLPSSSATPRRMSGPIVTCATSCTVIGVPC